SKTVGFHRRQEFEFWLAHKQAVFILARREGLNAEISRTPLRLDHSPRPVVRTPRVADLALPDQVVESSKGFFDRRQRVRLMNLVEIDPIGLEAAETGLDRQKN